MSKRCPDCGFINDDSRIYCGSCGELLDADLRLLQQLEESTKNPVQTTGGSGPESENHRSAHKYHKYYDDDNVGKLSRKKKKSSPVPWVILGIAAVAAVIAVIVLL